MTKVITTVGTSLIVPNLFKVCSSEVKEVYLNTIRKLGYDEWHLYPVEITLMQQHIYEWLKTENSTAISAEVNTLARLYNHLGESLHVVLLATDTVASVLAARFIRQYLLRIYPEWRVEFCAEVLRIKDLNVNQPELFQQGIMNFMQLLSQHALPNSYLNMSGGFKSMIPFSTIIAAQRDMTLCYTHELAQNLILVRPNQVNTSLHAAKSVEIV